MADKSRPFFIKVKLGARLNDLEARLITRRGPIAYIWYQSPDRKATIILESNKRPPAGWNGKGVEKHPHLAEWQRAIEEGDKSPTLEARAAQKERDSLLKIMLEIAKEADPQEVVGPSAAPAEKRLAK